MRNRILKEGFFRNYELAQLPPLARILFEGLWLMADKEGRLWDRPQQIKAEVLPYDDCNADDLLAQLANSNFILRYEAQGKKCIEVVNFAKHQTLTTWEKNNLTSDIPTRSAKRKTSKPQQTANESPTEEQQTDDCRTSESIVSISVTEQTEGKCSRSRSALAIEVFEYWKSELGKNGTAKLDAKRKRLVEQRLADNDVEFIKQAIRGIKRSAFHMGENTEHKVYDGLNLICRDQEKLESFAALDVPRRAPPVVEEDCRDCRNTGLIKVADPLRGYEEFTKPCKCEYGTRRSAELQTNPTRDDDHRAA